MPEPPQPSAHARVRALINGFRNTDLIATAAEFGLADHLAAGPKTAEELAALSGTHAPALKRLLRALAHIEVVRRLDDGRFELGPLGEPLRTDAAESLRGIARARGLDMYRLPWLQLPYSVRTGETSLDHIFGLREFEYLATQPEAAAIFNDSQLGATVATAAAAVEAYDFSQFDSVIDVGGGKGTLAAAVVKATTQTRGIVFDLPFCADGATEFLASEGISDRCHFVGGDFFEGLPPNVHAYLLKSVLHDWEDEKAVAILESCRRAMHASSKVLIFELVMPPEGAPTTEAVFSDLTMLVHTGGKERTEAEFDALLHAAGFRLNRIIPTRAAMSVIEVVAA